MEDKHYIISWIYEDTNLDGDDNDNGSIIRKVESLQVFKI